MSGFQSPNLGLTPQASGCPACSQSIVPADPPQTVAYGADAENEVFVCVSGHRSVLFADQFCLIPEHFAGQEKRESVSGKGTRYWFVCGCGDSVIGDFSHTDDAARMSLEGKWAEHQPPLSGA